MKRLNKKGFTLIELLAVIVILAIVLVVTIPSVINTMNDARDKSLQNAADTVQEWYTKQYEIAVMGSSLGSGTNDTAYTNFAVTTTAKKFNAQNGDAALVAAGVSNPTTNLDTSKSSVQLLATKKVCVKLAAKSGGNFYVNATGYTNCKCSSGCGTGTCTCN